MQYREQLLAYIGNPDIPAFEEWLQSQSPLDRVEIYTELTELVRELSANDPAIAEMLGDMANQIAHYQDAYLDEKLADLNVEIAKDEAEKGIAKFQRDTPAVKVYVRECIELNAPNANEMRQLARKIIEFEQEIGTYDPVEWAWLTDR